MLLLLLRLVEQYAQAARPLLLRETLKALVEMEEELDLIFTVAYGRGIKHNRAEHMFLLPNGAIIELGQLETASDYKKYAGRSFTFLGIDEAGQLRDMRWVNLCRANLRSPKNIPLRTVLSANPGGTQHAQI